MKEDQDTGISSHRTSAMLYLLQKGLNINAQADCGSTALQYACESGQQEMIQFLLQRGAVVPKTNHSYEKAHHTAARSGDTSVAKMLLNAGLPIDSKDNKEHTPLIMAVKYEKASMIELSLKSGADTEVQGIFYWLWPLCTAAYNDTPAIIESLLIFGASIESGGDHGQTPLTIAVSWGETLAAKALLDGGANVYAAMYGHGLTAIMFVAEHDRCPRIGKHSLKQCNCCSGTTKRADMIELLCKGGADLSLVTIRGHSALDYAKSNKSLERDDLIKILEKYGAT
ncbi:hypothetical protein OEA41_009781 [Lepraria neglecta]|uniref:Ankyrin repeat protein n=1 Tax=Lepraria neglecta TaxID=209136 RepID=A0AAD9YWJ8_9LECA|nr:hypothetical protein OEA41_009781 [Lepraria neglecta]